ncbi:MAG: ArsA-related P-loop ATPase, partial [Aquificota bacterium]|nr:ArsA-related P-loop ATPase [Aquificota bacterium]
FKALENFYEKLKGVDEILVDPETTSVRLVVNPEKMVIRESQRAFMYFNLFGVNVDAVIVNRVIPKDLEECAYFKEWVSIQKRYIEEVETFFSPVPVLKVPLMKEEVLGEERLRELSGVLYGERDPADVLFKERPYEFVKEDRGYTLKIKAPSVTKEKVSLLKSDDEIVVRVGNFKSHIMLPRKLRNLDPKGAKIEEGYIKIRLA